MTSLPPAHRRGIAFLFIIFSLRLDISNTLARTKLHD
ncbi:MAG: hypothetical protein GXO25_00720 [Euryarchaeota archaeon]|nr:hypothetical protein [Euryarchaeota archaeon]